MKKDKTLNVQKLIIAIFVLYFCSVFIYSIIKFFITPTSTILVENGKISQEETASGFIIRDEVIIKGDNYKNGMEKIKFEGDKVAKDEIVFRYYLNDEAETKQKIQELDEKIQDVLSNESKLYSSDIKTIDKQISTKLSELYNSNNIQEIYETKKTINSLITKKAKISGELSPSGSYLKKLVEERTGYENSLNTDSEKVTAPISGIVSYRIDSLEEKFTSDDLSYLTKDFLSKINLKTGQIVASNEESGKIVNNYKCYIATYLTSKESENVKEGNTVEIRLSNSDIIKANIVKINPEKNGRVIVFEVTEKVESLIEYRKVSFDIIWWGKQGLKVSNKAITKENNLNYVEVLKAGTKTKVLVKVLKQDETDSIITSYTTSELKELGYTSDEIKAIKKIKLYDKILIKH